MWPWEHLAFGYVAYSVSTRLWWDEPPAATAAVVLAVATQLPDFLDKLLAWEFKLFTTGYGAAHSVFVGVPGVVAVAGVLRSRGRSREATALVVGYFSHLSGDIIAGHFTGTHTFARVLWPVVALPGYQTERDFLGRLTLYLGQFWQTATGTDPLVVVTYASALVAPVLLWIYDGAPGVRVLWLVTRANWRGG